MDEIDEAMWSIRRRPLISCSRHSCVITSCRWLARCTLNRDDLLKSCTNAPEFRSNQAPEGTDITSAP
jgi:hypothetical protein